jgi:hypothetical protein
MAEISISIAIKYFWGDSNILATFKMTVAIAFLCENAVEAIEVQNHRKK